MFTINRYDKLIKEQKDLRNRIQDVNNKANAKVEKLQIKIAKIKYQRDIKCGDLNNKLTDAISLTKNEVARIKREEQIMLGK